ncbi:phage tail tape measure protein [Cytophaga sp. FL35]|uniref:phage tail tape measure protein n=1 Tax=Cytophaga sp. FL35 TaxID=1904456 RepID=UPI001653DBF7|nr:phage tail tape measure protein [Cytophaga sp. FL35]MBC6999682.1 phage tail tape measure protein [Cytophaga sp. FL35]
MTDKFASNSIGALQRFDNKMTRSFKKLGRLGQLAVGLSAGAVFSTAIQNNIEYNSSLMSLSSITGAVGKDLAILEKHALDTGRATGMMGKNVLTAMEELASAQPVLLNNSKALAQITKHAITLSQAARMDLGVAADSLATSLNQFGLGSEHALKAIDALSAGSVYGSSKIPQTADALSKFGTVAAATGTKLNESIALVQLVSKFEKGSEAGTKLRNILGTIAGAKILPKEQLNLLSKMGVDIDKVTNKAIPLNDRLLEFAKVGKDNNVVMKLFGKENSALAQALFNNASGFEAMLKNVNKTGVAQMQADKNMSSFAKRLEKLKNNFFNVTTATNSDNKALAILGSTMDWVGNNMETIVGIGAGMIGMYGTLKGLIWGSQIASVAYNIALGAKAALSSTASIAIGKNAIALGAYKTVQLASTAVTWMATAASTAFGVALNAGLWPILAVVAAVTGLIFLFKNLDNVMSWLGKQWEKFTNWISNLWDGVVKWFHKFDFKGFFMGIGQSILKFMLLPLKGVLSLLSKLPGKVGDLAKMGLDKIGDITGEVGVKPNPQDGPLDSPAMSQARSESLTRAAMVKGQIGINISDPGRLVESTSSNGNVPIPVHVSSTQGAF